MSMNLNGMRSTSDVLARTNHGKQIAQLLRSLGFWAQSDGTVAQNGPRQFPTDVSTIEQPTELANAQLYWQSELSRVTELLGVLEGEKYDAKLDAKRLRAVASADLLDEQQQIARADRLKSTEMKMKVEVNEQVIEADERLAFVETIIASLEGLRTSIEGKCRVLSREQTRRDNELQARVRY